MSFDALGISFKFPEESDKFVNYLQNISLFDGCAGLTFHHTASPNLQQRPNGLTDQHMVNIKNYYSGNLNWSSGPHFFVDDHRLMLMTPINERGIHAKSFNRNRLGLEVLGDYDYESPKYGRGLVAWDNAALTYKLLKNQFVQINDFNFHRNDPKTSKTCPGKLVDYEFIQNLLKDNDIRDNDGVKNDNVTSELEDIRVAKYKNKIIAPISETLFILGLENSYDSSSWSGINVVYYDDKNEESWGELSQILSKV